MDLEISFDLVSFYDGYDNFRVFCLKIQKTTHGMALFTIPQKESKKTHEAWLVFAKKGSEVIGAMHYTLKYQILNQALHTDNYLFSTVEGKFGLLNWIARHIDQVRKVILILAPDQTSENFYTDIRPEYQGLFVPPTGRVINLTAFEGLSCREGKISINLTDPNCDWKNGIWRLSNNNGGL